MKKVIAIVVLLLIVFVVYNRNRLYLRDPLAGVTHDGVKENGAQVYINFKNEVLIENDNPPLYTLVIQHDNHAGTPKELKCLHWLTCLTDADAATLVEPRTDIVVEQMSGKVVSYREAKTESVVTLR